MVLGRRRPPPQPLRPRGLPRRLPRRWHADPHAVPQNLGQPAPLGLPRVQRRPVPSLDRHVAQLAEELRQRHCEQPLPRPVRVVDRDRALIDLGINVVQDEPVVPTAHAGPSEDHEVRRSGVTDRRRTRFVEHLQKQRGEHVPGIRILGPYSLDQLEEALIGTRNPEAQFVTELVVADHRVEGSCRLGAGRLLAVLPSPAMPAAYGSLPQRKNPEYSSRGSFIRTSPCRPFLCVPRPRVPGPARRPVGTARRRLAILLPYAAGDELCAGRTAGPAAPRRGFGRPGLLIWVTEDDSRRAPAVDRCVQGEHLPRT